MNYWTTFLIYIFCFSMITIWKIFFKITNLCFVQLTFNQCWKLILFLIDFDQWRQFYLNYFWYKINYIFYYVVKSHSKALKFFSTTLNTKITIKTNCHNENKVCVIEFGFFCYLHKWIIDTNEQFLSILFMQYCAIILAKIFK